MIAENIAFLWPQQNILFLWRKKPSWISYFSLLTWSKMRTGYLNFRLLDCIRIKSKVQISSPHFESYFRLLASSKVRSKMRTGDLNFEHLDFKRIKSKVQISRPHFESYLSLLASSKVWSKMRTGDLKS